MVLSVGDSFPNHSFDVGDGTRWTPEVEGRSVPLVLILHRHLA